MGVREEGLVWESLSEEVTFQLIFKCEDVEEKSTPGRRNSMCKGPGVASCLVSMLGQQPGSQGGQSRDWQRLGAREWGLGYCSNQLLCFVGKLRGGFPRT